MLSRACLGVEMPYMFSMLSRKRPGKSIVKIWNWLDRDPSNWEDTSLNEMVVNSSGNIFVDLGFPTDEAVILQMRSDLMIDLLKFIETKNLTKDQAADILGVSQSRVSDLLNRKWETSALLY